MHPFPDNAKLDVLEAFIRENGLEVKRPFHDFSQKLHQLTRSRFVPERIGHPRTTGGNNINNGFYAGCKGVAAGLVINALYCTCEPSYSQIFAAIKYMKQENALRQGLQTDAVITKKIYTHSRNILTCSASFLAPKWGLTPSLLGLTSASLPPCLLLDGRPFELFPNGKELTESEVLFHLRGAKSISSPLLVALSEFAEK